LLSRENNGGKINGEHLARRKGPKWREDLFSALSLSLSSKLSRFLLFCLLVLVPTKAKQKADRTLFGRR